MQLQAEEDSAKEALRQTIGGLSDLRYGKFANGSLTEEVIDGLKGLQEACEGKS